MIIGFGNGDFWKLHTTELDRFEDTFFQSLLEGGTNAVELHCRDVASLDFFCRMTYLVFRNFNSCHCIL